MPNFGGRPPNPQTERKKHQSRPCYPIGTVLGTKQTRRKGREGIEDWKFVWPPKREREKQKEDPFFIFFFLLFPRLIQSQSLFIPRYLFVVVEKFSIFEVRHLPNNMLFVVTLFSSFQTPTWAPVSPSCCSCPPSPPSPSSPRRRRPG